MNPLGRIKPPDWKHVETHPISALAAVPKGTPVPVGFNWYTSFDTPKEMASTTERMSYHLPDVSKGESLGTVRGGHCFCLEPEGAVRDNTAALQAFYEQGSEGACEGFGHSRAMSIIRNLEFDAFWLYDEARRQEGTYPNGEGSTNRSACAALQKVGHRVQANQAVCTREVGDGPVEPSLGISSYHWATTAQQVLEALDRLDAQAVPFVNSWGTNYPGVVWLPVPTLERLLSEEGEASILIPR